MTHFHWLPFPSILSSNSTPTNRNTGSGCTCETSLFPLNKAMASEVQDFGFVDSPNQLSHSSQTRFPSDQDDEGQGFFTTGLGDVPLEMFKVERAQLNLNITIHQLVVSNNILIMVSKDSRIYKIDLSLQEQIVGIFPPI